VEAEGLVGQGPILIPEEIIILAPSILLLIFVLIILISSVGPTTPLKVIIPLRVEGSRGRRLPEEPEETPSLTLKKIFVLVAWLVMVSIGLIYLVSS
jgi:hypothetical protein